jgi:hypothetical protein
MHEVDSFIEQIFRPDDFVPANHPLQSVRRSLDDTLSRTDTVFSRQYDSEHSSSHPFIVKARPICSNRVLTEQIFCKILFRGLSAYQRTMRSGIDPPASKIAPDFSLSSSIATHANVMI